MANSNEHMREYMITRYHKRRQEAMKRLGNQCAACGSTESLEFDHIDPTLKSFSIGKRIVSAPDNVLEEELAKCQLLCKDCHVQKHATAKGTHGTISSYNYCRCDICREAKRVYNREYKKQMREKLRKQ